MLTVRFVSAALGLALASGAAAHWNPGDPHKMHYPQLPDPQGWDVNFTRPQTVADDWMCSGSGAVTDVHFWFSYKQDFIVPVTGITVDIYDDVPAGAANPYSRPGNLLWSQVFSATAPNVAIIPYGTGQQGWLDPKNNIANYPDHQQYFQANIVNIANPFVQTQGTIYWLALSLELAQQPGTNAEVGWKTTLNPFNDSGVWTHFIPGVPPLWHQLVDPQGLGLDLAFVITPTPGAGAILALAGVMGAFRHKRERLGGRCGSP